MTYVRNFEVFFAKSCFLKINVSNFNLLLKGRSSAIIL